jgi:hypothetical protein
MVYVLQSGLDPRMGPWISFLAVYHLGRSWAENEQRQRRGPSWMAFASQVERRIAIVAMMLELYLVA